MKIGMGMPVETASVHKSRMGCKAESMVWTKDIRHRMSIQAQRVSGVVGRHHMVLPLTGKVDGINRSLESEGIYYQALTEASRSLGRDDMEKSWVSLRLVYMHILKQTSSALGWAICRFRQTVTEYIASFQVQTRDRLCLKGMISLVNRRRHGCVSNTGLFTTWSQDLAQDWRPKKVS